MDLSNIVWPAVALVIGIVAIFVFKEPLSKKIDQLRHLRWSGGGADFFGDEIARIKPKAQKVGADLHLPEKSNRTKTITEGELVSLAPRDIVLISWGRMRQRLFDSVASRGVAPQKSKSVVNVLTNLSKFVTVPEEVNDLAIFLDRLGEDLAQKTSIVPELRDANVYADYIDLLMAWLHLYVVDSSRIENRKVVSGQPSRRDTIVSSGFHEPSTNAATAQFIGLSGAFNGKIFNIEKPEVRIGAEGDNDLQLSGDEFVSSYHAKVRFDGGLLLIEDSGSTNGTFLNRIRLEPGQSRSLRIGDQIKVGESILEVRST